MTADECHLCGGPPDHVDGNSYLCDDCRERLEAGRSTPTEEEDNVGEPAAADSSTTDAEGWDGADFTDPNAGVYARDRLQREQWMGRKGKLPFAPWGDQNADLECSHATCFDHGPDTDEAVVSECADCQAHREGTTTAECEHDARYKWGHTGHYVDGETVGIAEDDPRLDGRVFIQRDDDEYAFVDGDDVRCPDTGEVHPAFMDVLKRLGITYADVSVSDCGVHADYRGELPEGVKQVVVQLDSEPWGANDDPPALEIYEGKHVCVDTGKHVPGTPLETREWDAEALLEVLDEYDELPDRDPTKGRESFDLDNYEADATESHESTEEIRDVWAAIDRLDARAVAEKTIVRGWKDPKGAEHRAFIPTWADRSYDGTANYATSSAWTDSGTHGGWGGPTDMAAIDCAEIAVDETDSPVDWDHHDWWTAVEHLRDLGFSIPEYVGSRGDAGDREQRDPRDVDVTADPKVAWRAAAAVVPTDLDEQLPLEVATDGERVGWKAPGTGELVDVVRAVALANGAITGTEQPLEAEEYHRAYQRAREVYGAPLPRYLTNEDATARYDVLLAAIRECGFFDLDRDALRSDVTAEGDEVGGEAVLALNPAWRESESGESVLVFDSGVIWDAATETAVDVVRFVALDAGRENPLLNDPKAPLEGEEWRKAVSLARTEYGAPLPRYNAGKPDEHVPLLPPSSELVNEAAVVNATDELDSARDDVEGLFRDLAKRTDSPSVLRALPSLGKTTSAVKTAVDRPTTYLAPRKELQEDAAEKADEYGATWMYLPVMGGSIRDDVLAEALKVVREEGKDRLRHSLLEDIDAPDGVLADNEEEDGESVDLGRPTCGCAEGEHGDEWALAVHVARELDYTPRDIHTRDRALFGAELPCQRDGECAYTEGWDAVSDPDAPADLLIGSYVHAHVESARTHYSRGPDGGIHRRGRAVVIDEFPGVGVFAEDFDSEAFDHVLWLARALRAGVDDLRDVYEGDLWSDRFVRAWLDGEGDELEAVGGVRRLLAAWEAVEAAKESAATVHDVLDDKGREEIRAAGVLDALEDLNDTEAGDDLSGHMSALEQTLAAADRKADALPGWVIPRLRADVLEPLAHATDGDLADDPTAPLEGVSIGEEIRELVAAAVDAVDDDTTDATGLLEAARAALAGGDVGVRELAVWSDHGYAHRDAHHLLRGVIAPAEGDAGDRLGTQSFTYDDDQEDGTTLDRVTNGRVTTLVDRNGKGATVHEPPSRACGSGEPASFIGLDATARRELWSLALGESVTIHDIHDSDAERRAFLRETLGLQVMQVGQEARPYEGSPDGKDLDGDVALLRELKERYTGVRAARERDEPGAEIDRPACITTKVVRERLEADDRLDGVVSAWDNYGNVTGDNDLGDHTLAAILGTQHYGHGNVEYLSALGGEEVTPAGRGAALDYGSELGNAYLKHMREDQLMQAALRFTRGESGALVVCRTSAIRDDLPLVGEGQVATTWSPTATALAKAWQGGEGDTFTASEVAERAGVDVTRRHVRRLLAELADAGYLRRVREGEGVATEYEPGPDTPEPAEFDLPTATAPGRDSHKVAYTANVRVPVGEPMLDRAQSAAGSVLPAPAAAAEGDPPD